MTLHRLCGWALLLVSLLVPSTAREMPASGPVLTYMPNLQLAGHLRVLAARCPLLRLEVIGRSKLGTDIFAVEVSDHPGEDEPEPHFKYVAHVHGDEPSGSALSVGLLEWLCDNYETDPRAKKLVNEMHLWIVPRMNPDGFERKQRNNAADIDLNRNFPDPWQQADGNGFTDLRPTGAEQPEAVAMMNFTLSHPFVGSASMHEGAVVANYPWDAGPDQSSTYSASPDDATFKFLASTYANAHHNMATRRSREFAGKHGITNGAEWYPLWGGMQDWNYIAGGCMELTLELSQHKWPTQAFLSTLFEDNLDALLALPLTAGLAGLRGRVLAEDGAPVEGVTLTVEGIQHDVTFHASTGFFARPLAPGSYQVQWAAPGYEPAHELVQVPADRSGWRRDIVLRRAPGHDPAQDATPQADALPQVQTAAGGALPGNSVPHEAVPHAAAQSHPVKIVGLDKRMVALPGRPRRWTRALYPALGLTVVLIYFLLTLLRWCSHRGGKGSLAAAPRLRAVMSKPGSVLV